MPSPDDITRDFDRSQPVAASGFVAQPIPARQIGPWRVISELGQGGFGIVYLGERADPAQKAALKLVKPGMDSRAVLSRFAAERQALALLSHPNIARLLDAGVHEGRPYFAMEYVPGLPITEYCERGGLAVPERLRLFQQVCHAVQHAHLKTIVHRDISARNVLVADVDGRPHAMVIDFGIAKALGVELTDATIDTGAGNVIGNYAYMSPEQAAGDPDVDARTDVYSLGVLLYEILTGTRPFSTDTLARAGDLAMRKVIMETEPPRPSSVATAPEMTVVLRRELEWIPLKALRKDRARRYQTPDELAADIGNYLEYRPLTAGPETRVYRARKFARRNAGALLATAAFLALAVGGTAAYVTQVRAAQARTLAALARADEQAAEAARQKREAERQRDEAKRQEAEALRQAEIAQAVDRFQTDMLTSADPDKLLGSKVTVLQAITASAKSLDDGALAGSPLVESHVRTTLGNTLTSLAEYGQAEVQFRRALELDRKARPPGDKSLTGSIDGLAYALQNNNKLEEADALFRESLEVARNAFPRDPRLIGTGLNNLAYLSTVRNKPAEAEAYYREAIALNHEASPRGDADTAVTLNNYAILLEDLGRLDEAEVVLGEVMEIRRRTLPPGHPQMAIGLNSLAAVKLHRGKLGEAEALFRESLQIAQKAHSKPHPDVAQYMVNLGTVLMETGKLDEAELLMRDALQICRTVFPADHPDVARYANYLAGVLEAAGKLAESEALAREAIDIDRRSLPPDDPNLGYDLSRLAKVYVARGDLAGAGKLYAEALVRLRVSFPKGDPKLARCLHQYAGVLFDASKFAEAEPLYREAADMSRSTRPDDPTASVSLSNLALALQAEGKMAEAAAVGREAIEFRRKVVPADDAELARYKNDLVVSYRALGRYEDAVALSREVVATREKIFGITHDRTCRAAFFMAQSLDALGRKDEADAIRAKYRLGDPATRPASQPATQP